MLSCRNLRRSERGLEQGMENEGSAPIPTGTWKKPLKALNDSSYRVPERTASSYFPPGSDKMGIPMLTVCLEEDEQLRCS